ncbi:hypothetical protein Bhyg_05770 [Pseudolycoriella hygida]|uniref:Uncharacterized protein n=1 Tax=Pseudolycoriella hygida TaxID=35572 RepID=A0A9Q0MZD3_9DIPT|nr:hypothetical protein Bhyg_05770 [Pseudolycoriella hygida]
MKFSCSVVKKVQMAQMIHQNRESKEYMDLLPSRTCYKSRDSGEKDQKGVIKNKKKKERVTLFPLPNPGGMDRCFENGRGWINLSLLTKAMTSADLIKVETEIEN